MDSNNGVGSNITEILFLIYLGKMYCHLKTYVFVELIQYVLSG
jgi:hypothetical protein